MRILFCWLFSAIFATLFTYWPPASSSLFTPRKCTSVWWKKSEKNGQEIDNDVERWSVREVKIGQFWCKYREYQQGMLFNCSKYTHLHKKLGHWCCILSILGKFNCWLVFEDQLKRWLTIIHWKKVEVRSGSKGFCWWDLISYENETFLQIG